MNEGGSENATETLAVHDSTAAAVVVPLGAGGPGIGRRAARPPRPKNRRIRRARDDARRGTPPRAARPGRYRADQREMPRRATCKLDSGFRSGFALRGALAAQISRFCRNCRPHARARHRQDRKSTRLNSSHGYISYAVFCLKKKTRPALGSPAPPCTPYDPPPEAPSLTSHATRLCALLTRFNPYGAQHHSVRCIPPVHTRLS